MEELPLIFVLSPGGMILRAECVKKVDIWCNTFTHALASALILCLYHVWCCGEGDRWARFPSSQFRTIVLLFPTICRRSRMQLYFIQYTYLDSQLFCFIGNAHIYQHTTLSLDFQHEPSVVSGCCCLDTHLRSWALRKGCYTASIEDWCNITHCPT